jgi:DNA-binding FrmR family transcriptional regulator|tara:strand:+ start:647 stop:931 length:285 start_codon:yes stop_codon:yes gene_type:complete
MGFKGTDHSKQIDSLKKIEGQIRGIIKMVEDERYCIDILNQFKAVFAVLEKVEGRVLEAHIEDCVKNAVIDDEKKAKNLLDELMTVVNKTERKK